MTTSITLRSIISASALSAIGALAMIAQTGTASAAKNALSCDGSSRRSVVECCETLVRKSGLPMALKREGKNCRTATVVCTKKTSGFAAVVVHKKCYFAFVSSGEKKGGKENPGGNPGGGGKSAGGGLSFSHGGKP